MRILSCLACVALSGLLFAQDATSRPADPIALARSAASAGRIAEALGHYTRALAANEDVALLREAGQLAGKELRTAEAAMWFQRLTELEPGSPAAWFDLGATRLNQGLFELAIECFRRVEALEATDAEVAQRHIHRLLHARAASALERHAEAIEQYSVARDRLPQDRDIVRTLAGAYFDAGRHKEAATVFQQLVSTEKRADHWYGLGASLGESGDLEGGLKALKEAQRLAPRDLRTLVKMGTFCLRKQDLIGAETALIMAREVAPRNYDVLWQLAQAARLGGRAEEAEEFLKEANALKASIDAMVEKRRAYKRALASAPNDAEGQFNHGLALLEYGAFDDAEVVFSRILSHTPNHLFARLNLASLRSKGGDMSSAFKHAVAACDAYPNDARPWSVAGRLALALRFPAKAAAFLERAVTLDPKDAEASKALSVCRQILGAASRPR